MSNALLEHYQKHKISPVKQNIRNIEQHNTRRKMLYQHLGLFPSMIRNAHILEVGPGGGYNSIATAALNPKSYTLVEPNPTAVSELKKNLEQYRSTVDLNISRVTLEEFDDSVQFDIVLCEGMVSGIRNRENLLDRLMKHVVSGGVLVITTQDEVSTFFEIFRYYLAQKIVNKHDNFETRIDIFEQAFSSHLKSLKYRTRYIRDWCADCLMGRGLLNQDFSIINAIDYFVDQAVLYQACPRFYVDRRWYKSFPSDLLEYSEEIKNSILAEYHNLLHYKNELPCRPAEKNMSLRKYCAEILVAVREYIDGGLSESESDKKLILLCGEILSNLEIGDAEPITAAIKDIVRLLSRNIMTIEDIGMHCPDFSKAFGHGQQYVSFIKA